MHSVFMIVLLVGCVAVSYTTAFEDDFTDGIETRRGLSLGSIGGDDRLLSNTNHASDGAAFVVQTQEVVIRPVSYTNITAIQVAEVGGAHNAQVSVVDGGIGKNFVRLSFRSEIGRGYSYNVRIHGRMGC